MVLRVPLDRQRPALDRVGEDHGRAVVLHLAVGLDQLADVVAAEVAERRAQLVVAELAGEGAELAAAAGQALAQLGRLGAQEALVLLVRHLVDAAPQGFVSGTLEETLKPPPILNNNHLPTNNLKHSN